MSQKAPPLLLFSFLLESESNIALKKKEGGVAMVGDFMVCVDRVIASAACFETVNSCASPPADAGAEDGGCSAGTVPNADSMKKKKMQKKKGGEMIECRICQEEGDEFDMEAPCACNGTLKVSLALSLPPSRVYISFSNF